MAEAKTENKYMTKDESELKQVVASVFSVDPETVSEQTSMESIANWDSLQHIKLVLALEEHFEISFTETQMVEIMSYPLIKTALSEHGISFAHG